MIDAGNRNHGDGVHHPCRLRETRHGPPAPGEPAALAAIEDHLISSGVAGLVERHDAPAAKTSELARVHPIEYIEAIREASPRNRDRASRSRHRDVPHTWDAALHAAGAAVLATDLVIGGRADSAFCAVRPPGHHATRTAPWVFAFSTTSPSGRCTRSSSRAFHAWRIIDFDVHHGNGTEDILQRRRRVVMASIFQHPFYPYSGTEHVAPNMANVPLPAGSDGRALARGGGENLDAGARRTRARR